jgi:adenosylhomocysteinase
MTAVPHDVTDPSLADAGKARIEWADRAMPVLRDIRERFATTQPFAGIKVAACMHVTAETANLVRTIAAGGAQVALCASNPLSTQDDTAAALVHHYGISVFARNGIDRDGYYAHINSALDIGPQLVFDDGCDLVNVLHTDRQELLEQVLAGCEETTTGVIRLRQMAADGALTFPMIAVNDTPTKHMFDNRYGTGQSAIDALLRSTNVLLAGKTMVVAGFGFCGQGVAERARGFGASVVVTEVDPVKALDAIMQGFRVLPMEQAAAVGDVFITVTGNRNVLDERHFSLMKDGAILANAGHFDIEIDVQWLEENAQHIRRSVRPHTDEYTLTNGRKVLLLAQGRLVNLGAAEGHPADVMDLSFADQALTAEWLMTAHTNLTAWVHDVPAWVDQQVARLKLASMGVAYDELTTAQQDYLGSWSHGS